MNEVYERLAHLYEELNVAVMVILRESGEIVFFNRHVRENVKRVSTDIQGHRYEEIFEVDFARLYTELAGECQDDQPHTRIFYWEGGEVWEQVSAQRTTWLLGRPAIVLTIANITDVSRSEYEYKQMAYYDRLLHLPNGEKLENDIASMSSFDRAALIHFDIDRFANINDIYGWDAGDQLLRKIRDWLLTTLRHTSRLYRTNDDEFCLFIQNISPEGVKERAEEILSRFRQPWELQWKENQVQVYCTLEMGIVYGKLVRGDMRNILYRTTHAPGYHRPGYSLYDEEMDARLREGARLRHDLVNCVKNDMRGFSVYYQPIVNAKSEAWIGAEALCRWFSPRGVAVSPAVFIPEIEKLGLIGEMDRWVRETALRQCMEWGLHRREFLLDMNLSPLQPISDAFIEELMAAITRLAYPRDKLSLEITETAKMDFSSENMRGLRHLRDEGIILTLDDFGTGYSTFENLVKIPAKVLKTERVFTQTLEQDTYYRYLMGVMVDIAHTVGMELIAEGVETEKQKTLLQSYGVDFLQGYLFAQPLPPHRFAEEIHRFTK